MSVRASCLGLKPTPKSRDFHRLPPTGRNGAPWRWDRDNAKINPDPVGVKGIRPRWRDPLTHRGSAGRSGTKWRDCWRGLHSRERSGSVRTVMGVSRCCFAGSVNLRPHHSPPMPVKCECRMFSIHHFAVKLNDWLCSNLFLEKYFDVYIIEDICLSPFTAVESWPLSQRDYDQYWVPRGLPWSFPPNILLAIFFCHFLSFNKERITDKL